MAARQIFLSPTQSVGVWASIGCFGTKCFKWSHESREFVFLFSKGNRTVTTSIKVPKRVTKILVVTDPHGKWDPKVVPMTPPRGKMEKILWERGFYRGGLINKVSFIQKLEETEAVDISRWKYQEGGFAFKKGQKCGFLYRPHYNFYLPYLWWAEGEDGMKEIASLLEEEGYFWDQKAKAFYE